MEKENQENNSDENVKFAEYEDFIKLELRTAKILNAEEIKGADKLYKLTLDDGTEKPRTICAGIKEYYEIQELEGKIIIIIANLKPRKLRGIESQGMLLAAETIQEGLRKVSLLTLDQDFGAGCEIH